MNAIFQPLRTALQQSTLGPADMIDMAMGFFASEHPQTGAAMLQHASDILKEAKDGGKEYHYPSVIAEVYWRTFYDHEAAEVYQSKPFPTEEKAQEFTTYMLKSIEMDDDMIEAQDRAFPDDFSKVH